MTIEVHDVVKDAADADELRTEKAVEEEVTRPVDHAFADPGTLAAVPQVVAPQRLAQLRALYAAWPHGNDGKIL